MSVWTQTSSGTRMFGDNGYVIEWGTWNDANGDGTGTITAATSTAGSPTLVPFKIVASCFTSDGSHAVIQTASTTLVNTVAITCTAGDHGTYALIGKAR